MRKPSMPVIGVFLTLLFSLSVLQAEHDGKVQILLLGDSTTEGSVPRRLKPKGPHLEEVTEQLLAAEKGVPACHVINSSLSGEYIRRLIDSGRYDRDAAKLPGLDYILIRYGLNDHARLKNFPTDFPKDFQELLARLRKDHPKAKLILMTVIPFFDEEKSKVVNDLILQVSRDEKLPVFDIYPRYAAELKKGKNMLNYRRYSLNQIPEKYREWMRPLAHGKGDKAKIEIMDNEFDSLFGHLPGWYSDRHPNLAGYNVIADETAKYLTPILKARAKAKAPVPALK